MNAVTQLVAASAIALLAATGAQAEVYQGVHPLTTELSRASLQSQARVAAQNFAPFGDLQASRVHASTNERLRSDVRAEAAAASKDSQAFGEAAGMGVM